MLRTLDGCDPFEDAIPGMRIGEQRSLLLDGHMFRIVDRGDSAWLEDS